MSFRLYYQVFEDREKYDALIARLNCSKTSPGTPWLHFWRAYDETAWDFAIDAAVENGAKELLHHAEIEGL